MLGPTLRGGQPEGTEGLLELRIREKFLSSSTPQHLHLGVLPVSSSLCISGLSKACKIQSLAQSQQQDKEAWAFSKQLTEQPPNFLNSLLNQWLLQRTTTESEGLPLWASSLNPGLFPYYDSSILNFWWEYKNSFHWEIQHFVSSPYTASGFQRASQAGTYCYLRFHWMGLLRLTQSCSFALQM